MDTPLVHRFKNLPRVFYHESKNATYRRILTEEEESVIWQAVAENRRIWNGETVRLVGLRPENDKMTVERSDYRTLVTSHLLSGAMFGEILDETDRRIAVALNHIPKAHLPSVEPSTWDDLLGTPGWGNTLGLMLWLFDVRTGMVLVATRSNEVVDGAGDRISSVGGSVEPKDCAGYGNPLVRACLRECQEELRVTPTAIDVLGLVAAHPKWQPAVVAVGTIDQPADPTAEDAWESASLDMRNPEDAEFDGLSGVVWPIFKDSMIRFVSVRMK